MKRQWLVIILLLASAALLRLQIYTEHERGDAREKAGQLTSVDPDTMSRIRIQRAADTLEFIKQGESWQMVKPEQAAANPERITELRALAILDVLASYDANKMDLAAYGLKPPQLSVWLDDTRIDFGALNPANQRRYVLVGQRLNLIADNIFPILNLPAEKFVAPPPDKKNEQAHDATSR
jgi:hypothetical protein